MQIPDKLQQQINSLKTHGDIQRIADESGYHYNTVYKAFTSGIASPELVEVIAAFYAEREELFREYMD
jgi:hypothetical protein